MTPWLHRHSRQGTPWFLILSDLSVKEFLLIKWHLIWKVRLWEPGTGISMNFISSLPLSLSLSLSLADGNMKGRKLKQLGLAYFLSFNPLSCCLRERTSLPLSAQPWLTQAGPCIPALIWCWLWQRWTSLHSSAINFANTVLSDSHTIDQQSLGCCGGGSTRPVSEEGSARPLGTSPWRSLGLLIIALCLRS